MLRGQEEQSLVRGDLCKWLQITKKKKKNWAQLQKYDLNCPVEGKAFGLVMADRSG